MDHCTEQNVPVPVEPIVFNKFSSAITEPNGAVELPDIVKVGVVSRDGWTRPTSMCYIVGVGF